MRIILCVAVLFFTLTRVYAQDPHFSQFFASPLTLNPAYTGKFDGTFRVAGNYRNQWPTINNAFTTATASIDFPILAGVLPTNDVWGVGIMGLNDRSGNKILNNNFLTISSAYHKGLDENGYHQISVGFQGTFASKRLDIARADFQDELTALGFTGVTSEIFNNQQVVTDYFDLNTGIMYYGTTNGSNHFYAGVSVYHVNRPSESFQGGSFVLEPRVTVHGGGYLPVGEYKTLHGSVLHQRQAGANETVLGGAMAFNVNYSEDNPIELYTGLWYRFNDAFIPYIGMEISGFRIGFSYDINNSSLNTASNSRGGTEFSLIYIRRPADPSLKKLNCPKF
jgi:type IX secretion system PorP/SprF family membrane protein